MLKQCVLQVVEWTRGMCESSAHPPVRRCGLWESLLN